MNVLADDSTENVNNETDAQLAEPHKWGDNATWWIKDSVLYLDGTSLQPTYSAHNGVVARKIMDTPWNQDPEDYSKPTVSSKITKVVINPDTKSNLVLPPDSSALFRSLSEVTEFVGLNKLDISNVTDFSYMFSDEPKIQSIDMSSFKTPEDVNLTQMFDLNGVQSIDLSGFTNSKDTVTDMFDSAVVQNVTLAGLNLKGSGINGRDSSNKDVWVKEGSDSDTLVSLESGDYTSGTWKRILTNSADFKISIISNKKLNFEKNEQVVSSDESENIKDSEVEVYKNYGVSVKFSDDAYKTDITISGKAFQKVKFAGESIDIDMPVISGYKPDVSSIKATIIGYCFGIDSPYQLLISSGSDASYVEKLSLGDESHTTETGYTVYYTKDKSTPSTHHTSTSTTTPTKPTTPTVTSKFTHKLQTLTAYPDRSAADVYDENGNLSKTVALSPNSDWQTDEYMTIKGEKYYRVATNEFVKASDIYLYEDKDSVVRTHGGVDYISLDNSHGDTVTNRALAVKTDWKTDKVIKINNEDYYRVATNEFVKADNVDVIR